LVGVFLQFGATLYAQAPGSKEIALKQTFVYGEQVVQVSFNGDSESFGTFRITDGNGRVVFLTQEAELIPAPNYFSVNIDAFEKGEYIFSVQTTKSVYETRFTIQ
jgi:hypothetical protein